MGEKGGKIVRKKRRTKKYEDLNQRVLHTFRKRDAVLIKLQEGHFGDRVGRMRAAASTTARRKSTATFCYINNHETAREKVKGKL